MSIPTLINYAMPTAAHFPDGRVDWTVDPSRAVLLIHDMQDYFLRFYASDSILLKTLIAHLVEVKQWCKKQGIPVVYTAQPPEQSPADRALLNDMWGPGLTGNEDQQHVVQPLTPSDQDTILVKWRYSAFQRSDLLQRMKLWNRDQLLIGGVYAHIGCMVTAVDAFMNDIQPFMIGDAVAAFSPENHRMALDYVAQYCGRVIDTAGLTRGDAVTDKVDTSWLNDWVLRLVEEESVDPDENLIYYGLDSIQVMNLAAELKARGIEVSFEELACQPTLNAWERLIEQKRWAA